MRAPTTYSPELGRLQLLYDPGIQGAPMKLACLMSGSGTNVRKIVERERSFRSSPYKVGLIFSDNSDDNARAIGGEYDIPVVSRDIKSFYEHRGKKKNWFIKRPELDAGTREEFDSYIVDQFHLHGIDFFALGGYMSALSNVVLREFTGLNVHPADLSLEENGKRKYTGDKAVRDAVLAGEKTLRSSVHVVRDRVDYGEVIMISDPLAVELPRPLEELRMDEKLLDDVVNVHQTKLKEKGDWVIFPRALQEVAEGRIAVDGKGAAYRRLEERWISTTAQS